MIYIRPYEKFNINICPPCNMCSPGTIFQYKSQHSHYSNNPAPSANISHFKLQIFYFLINLVRKAKNIKIWEIAKKKYLKFLNNSVHSSSDGIEQYLSLCASKYKIRQKSVFTAINGWGIKVKLYATGKANFGRKLESRPTKTWDDWESWWSASTGLLSKSDELEL